MRSKRFEHLAERPVNKETFVQPWPEVGLAVENGPDDPAPSLKIEDGAIVEMDGRSQEEFDLLDIFIVENCLDPTRAEKAMAVDSLEIARMMVDINVSRDEVLDLTLGCTPAKLVEIVGHLNVLEMMMGLSKMRARKRPANQAHVTNRKENPALLAADAAEAALRGFDEIETTVGVARYASLNALSILVGSQTGRGGVLTQCAVEEMTNLRLGLKGLTTYSETLSVYGTENTFIDGDDTPWSKAFLASAYASRGVKTRFTSGTGSEALMGHAEGKSMLYLEARCLLVTRGAGSQGSQNGSISCIALPESLPGGVRVVLAENLLATMLGLEVASGNDALSSHSEMRKTAKLMLQFIPGTDFITSGYGAIPRYDNMFGGGNFDVTELDDWYVLQRDMRIDGGLFPVEEEDVLKIREKGARAIQGVFEELGLPAITEEEVAAAITAFSSQDLPDRDKVADIERAHKLMHGETTSLDVIKALHAAGFEDVAANLTEMQRNRAVGDHLQPSAIFDENFEVLSVLTQPNDYKGPGTGYRLDGERWEKMKNLPRAGDPKTFIDPWSETKPEPWLIETGEAETLLLDEKKEVVIALGPGFGDGIEMTIGKLDLRDVLHELLKGCEDEGVPARVIRVHHTSDLAFIGHTGAHMSGSGICIGVQPKGTTIIHCRVLPPLENLELFPQAPNLELPMYRRIGRNAARYALRKDTSPVGAKIDNFARLRLIVHNTLLHLKSTRLINKAKKPTALEVK